MANYQKVGKWRFSQIFRFFFWILYIILVKNRNFWQEIEIFVKNRIFWQEREFFVKNSNFCQR